MNKLILHKPLKLSERVASCTVIQKNMEVFLQYVRHLPYAEQVPLLLTAMQELREEFFQLGADAACHPWLYHLRALNRFHLSRVHTELYRVQTYIAIYAEQPVPPCECTFCRPTNRVFPPRERYQQMPEYERQMPQEVPNGPPQENVPENLEEDIQGGPADYNPEEADAEFLERVAAGMVRAWLNGADIPEVDDHVLDYMDI